MEKSKLSASESMRHLSRNKINTSHFLSPGLKSIDSSLNKTKVKKSSLKNIGKPTYLVKKNLKKGQQISMYKTSVQTPIDTTILMSCISTPNSRSMEKRNFFKNLHKVQKNQQTFKALKQNFMSTCEGRGSEDSLKIVFIIGNTLRFEKYFSFSETLQQVKEDVVNQIEKRQKKYASGYGIVALYSVKNNVGIDKLLSNPDLKLQAFRTHQIFQLNLKVVIAKKEPSYKNLQLSDFQLLKFLGNGGFSSVFLARNLIDGSLCALKFIKKSSIVTESKYRMLENQKNILFTIDHHRLVDLYYAFQSKNYIIFGLQFCPNGNLYQLMEQRKTLTEEEGKFLFSQILQGLNALHHQKILFRDIKLQNILFDEFGGVKITDFGLSKPDLDEEDITYSYCGSPEYMAPEMLAKTGHTYQIDHYALGILLYELLFGKSPFYALKKQDIFYAIMNSQPQFPKSPVVSKEVKSLIKGLLEKNPKKRIGSLKGIDEITSHPWLRGFTTKGMESPFKIPLSQQNIHTREDQMKRISAEFMEDMNIILKQKVFFYKSFVNKFLVEKTMRNTLRFRSEFVSESRPESRPKSRQRVEKSRPSSRTKQRLTK